jgi:hypothetical protein
VLLDVQCNAAGWYGNKFLTAFSVDEKKELFGYVIYVDIFRDIFSIYFISLSSLSYDRSKASSKSSSPHSVIQSFLLQMRVSSPFLKVIQ